jgi:nitrite reductase (NADH) small subunit
MSQTIRIAAKSELPPVGQVREFDAAGRMICVANVDGEIRALDNTCLHHGAPLGQAGVVLDGKVICAWHAWAYDTQTGACGQDPTRRLRTHPVRIDGDDVFVEI